MKKLIAIAVLLVGCAFAPCQTELYILTKGYACTVSFYTTDSFSCENGVSVTRVGQWNEITCSEAYAPIVRKSIESLSGQSATVYTKTAQEIMIDLSATTIFTQSVDGIDIYYAYSPRLGGGVTVNGEKINLELAQHNGKVTVGTPLILGSY